MVIGKIPLFEIAEVVSPLLGNLDRTVCLDINADNDRFAGGADGVRSGVKQQLLQDETLLLEHLASSQHLKLVAQVNGHDKGAIDVDDDGGRSRPVAYSGMHLIVVFKLAAVKISQIGIVVDVAEDVNVVKSHLHRCGAVKFIYIGKIVNIHNDFQFMI